MQGGKWTSQSLKKEIKLKSGGRESSIQKKGAAMCIRFLSGKGPENCQRNLDGELKPKSSNRRRAKKARTKRQ